MAQYTEDSMSKISKQLYNRRCCARRLQLKDYRLVRQYGEDLEERVGEMDYYERTYKERVITAAARVRAVFGNYPDKETRIKFLDRLRNSVDRAAVCDELHISDGTYANWYKEVLQVMTQVMGIWV